MLDISVPQNPELVGRFDTPGAAYDAYKMGNFLYVADGYQGILVLDVSNPRRPKYVASKRLPGYHGSAVSIQIH
ncbi:MAG: hypothetical protein ABIM31_00340 [candidate division WOR-3 bacterium]